MGANYLQCSVLGPILFNIFLIDLFFILNDIGIASYADDIALYKACDKHWYYFQNLENGSQKAI